MWAQSVTSFCIVFSNKNTGIFVASLFFGKKGFLFATFVCFASFFSTGGSGKIQKVAIFIKINKVFVSTHEESTAQVSCLSFPKGSMGSEYIEFL